MMGQTSADDFLSGATGSGAGAPPTSSVDDFLGGHDDAHVVVATPAQSSGLLHEAKLGAQKFAQGAIDTFTLPKALDDKFRAIQGSLPGVVSQPTTSDNVSFDDGSGTPLVDPAKLSASIGTEQPNGKLEELAGAAAHGLGGAIPAMLMGGGAAPIATAISGALGGVSGQSAADAGWPAWAQTLAGLAPGLAVGGFSATRAASQETAAATAGLDAATAKVAALQRQNDLTSIDNPLVNRGLAAQLDDAKAAAKDAVNQVSIASAAARDVAKSDAQNVAQQEQTASAAGLETVAGAHGTSKTLQDAGTALQTAGRSWLNETLPAKQAAVWDPVTAAVDPKTEIPLSAFEGALKNINSSAGALEPLAQLLKPGLPAKLGQVLKQTNETNELTDTVPTLEDVQKLRTTLGSAMSNPATIRDVGSQNLAHLYASVTQDMRSGIGKVNPDAVDLFDQANAESKRLYGIAEGPIARIVGSPTPDIRFDPAPGKVASSLLSGGKTGDSDIAALKSEGLPVGELASAQLREDPSGWRKLSPEAQSTLVPDPNMRQGVDSALALAEQAPQKAKLVSAAADAAHKATVLTAKANADFGPNTIEARNNTLQQSAAESSAGTKKSILEAQDAQAAAKARFDALPQSGYMENMLQSIQHSHLGEYAGVILGMMKGAGVDLGDEVLGGAVGGALAHAAPHALRGAKAAVSSPGGLAVPLAGALGAQNSNPLAPGP